MHFCTVSIIVRQALCGPMGLCYYQLQKPAIAYMKMLRASRTPKVEAPQKLVKADGNRCHKLAGAVAGGIFKCLPGFSSGGEFRDDQRLSEQYEAPILVPARQQTLPERLQEAEEVAGRFVVKVVVQTAVAKAIQEGQ